MGTEGKQSGMDEGSLREWEAGGKRDERGNLFEKMWNGGKGTKMKDCDKGKVKEGEEGWKDNIGEEMAERKAERKR